MKMLRTAFFCNSGTSSPRQRAQQKNKLNLTFSGHELDFFSVVCCEGCKRANCEKNVSFLATNFSTSTEANNDNDNDNDTEGDYDSMRFIFFPQ